MEDCLFCKIVNKQLPSKIVLEDELSIAFEDINPQTPIHILIIPKTHYSSLNEIPEDEKSLLGHLIIKAKEIASQKGIDEKGYRLVLNTGKESGQAVFHIHLHLLGGRPMGWPPG
ncbi:MAG: histidine triad nucleotide-binding protein [Candidatus Aminicenantia bacterium]